MMKASLNSVSSLFSKWQFSANSLSFSLKCSTVSPKSCFVIRKTCLLNAIFQGLPKFCCRKSVCHDLWVLAVESSTPLHSNTEIEQGNRFLFGESPWLISTHYAEFYHLLEFFASAIPAEIFGLYVPVLTDYRSFVNGFQRQFYHFLFRTENFIHMIFSLASKANLYCTLHFYQRRVGSTMGLSQKALISWWVCLLAECAMSYFIVLLSALRRKYTPSI